MSDLKPCPFCGGEAEQERYDWWTFCSDCGVGFDGDPEGEKWNTRAGGWITDRDPEERVPVLVVRPGQWELVYAIDEWDSGCWDSGEYAIAWMPVPAYVPGGEE